MSAGISISFAPQIETYAEANDIDLSPEAAAVIDTILQGTMHIGEGNKLSFPISDNEQKGTLDDALGHYLAFKPRKVAKPAPSPSVPTGSNATARALAANAAVREGRSTARLAEAESLVEQHGNPWEPRSINRTRQGLVSNLHPDLAARLKRQAGVRA